jgi:membrane protein required for colicin V production
MLTAFDIIVIVLIGGGAILGVFRGFVAEVLSLFAWVAAIFALKLLHTPVTKALTGVVGGATAAAVLAFVLIFGIVFFGGRLIARQLGNRTRQSVLGSFDRALGLGFGALKGLLIATVIFLLVNLGYDLVFGARTARPEWLRAARTYPLLSASGRAAVDWVNRRRGAPLSTAHGAS